MPSSKPKRFLGYRVLWLLMSDKSPYTIHEVAHEVGCNPHCAYRHLKELWSMEFIHICAWDRNYQHWMPVYKWGNKPDKPRPEPLTSKEVRARRRLRDPTDRAIKCVYMSDRYREAMREDVGT